MWQRLTERERKLVLLLGAVCATVVFYLYLLGPQLDTFGEIRREAAAVARELAAAERVLDEMPARREELARTESELAHLRELFSLDARDGALIVNVGQYAAEGGVRVTLFRPLAVVEEEHLLTLPVEVGVRGAYPAVLDYLRSLQNLPNVSEIRRLSFHAEDQPPAGAVRAELLLLIHSDPSPAARRGLFEMGQWLTGRYDAFRPPGTGAPADGAPEPEVGVRPLK